MVIWTFGITKHQAHLCLICSCAFHQAPSSLPNALLAPIWILRRLSKVGGRTDHCMCAEILAEDVEVRLLNVWGGLKCYLIRVALLKHVHVFSALPTSRMMEWTGGWTGFS